VSWRILCQTGRRCWTTLHVPHSASRTGPRVSIGWFGTSTIRAQLLLEKACNNSRYIPPPLKWKAWANTTRSHLNSQSQLAVLAGPVCVPPALLSDRTCSKSNLSCPSAKHSRSLLNPRRLQGPAFVMANGDTFAHPRRASYAHYTRSSAMRNKRRYRFGYATSRHDKADPVVSRESALVWLDVFSVFENMLWVKGIVSSRRLYFFSSHAG